MSGLTIRVKRGSRGSETLLEAANRILRLLGVSSTKRGKQPSPKSKVRSMTLRASAFLYFTHSLVVSVSLLVNTMSVFSNEFINNLFILTVWVVIEYF